MGFFRWIATWRASNGENAVWVAAGLGVTSPRIDKNTFNFEAKVWWILAATGYVPLLVTMY